MGRYFQGHEKLKEVGRVLSAWDYAEAKRQLRSGEQLVGAFDRLIHYVCPLLDSESEYNAHYEQYKMGMYTKFNLYAVKNEDVATYVDK